MMAGTNAFIVTKPSDAEITVTRIFDAPRALAFDAFTKPQMVKNWLLGHGDWPLVECRIDLRVGGAFRYVWRNAEKGECGVSGTYKEISPPARAVHTELFDEDWTGGERVFAAVFTENDGRTTVAVTVRYSARAARDGALETDMTSGWSAAYDRLDAYLPSLAERTV